MKIISLIVLLTFLVPSDEAPPDIAALYAKAIAEKKPIATWYYKLDLAGNTGGDGWVKGNPTSRPGDLFRIGLNARRHGPTFRVSQITGPKTFLDLRNKFLVEGLETDGLVDDTSVSDLPVFTKIGYVKGSHTYETAFGTNTVLHIILIENPEFTLTEEEESDGFRVWTAADGRTKTVRKLVGRSGSRFKMMDRKGKQHTVGRKNFSEEDQKFLEEFQQ